MIDIDGEMWTLDELRDLVREPRCPMHCHGRGHTALPPADVKAIRSLYQRRSYRQSNAAELADRFGVSKRTVQRYVRRAA